MDEHASFCQKKGDYLYFISDILPKDVAEWYRWGYLCRVKTDGTGFKVLGKAQNFYILGDKIYYNRIDFDVKNHEKSRKVTYLGTWKMNLNGTKRSQVIEDNYYLVGAKGSEQYAAQTKKVRGAYGYKFSKQQLSNMDLSELKLKIYATDEEEIDNYTIHWNSHNEIYSKGNKLYIHATNAKNGNYRVLNLNTGKLTKKTGNWYQGDSERKYFNSTKKGTQILKNIKAGMASTATKKTTSKKKTTSTSTTYIN